MTVRTAVRVKTRDGQTYTLKGVSIPQAAQVLAEVAAGANVCLGASGQVTDRRSATPQQLGAGAISVRRQDTAEISLVVTL